MVKTICIICEEEITNPKIGILYCPKNSCKAEFEANMKELEESSKPKAL